MQSAKHRKENTTSTTDITMRGIQRITVVPWGRQRVRNGNGTARRITSHRDRPKRHHLPVPATHIDPGGVEGAFVGDAGVADGVRKPAVGQQAPPIVHNGFHHGNHEAHGRGGCQEPSDEAGDQQEPFLQEENSHQTEAQHSSPTQI